MRLIGFLFFVSAQALAEDVLIVRPAPELEARVRGQTSDLDLDIEFIDDAGLPADVPRRLERAESLEHERGSIALVWFDARPDRLLVYVAAKGRLLVRDLPNIGSSSAVLESAAVIIRSALRAIAAGGVIGVEAPKPHEPPSVKAVRAFDAALRRPAPIVATAPTQVRFMSEVGLRGLWLGPSFAGALDLRVAVGVGAFAVGASSSIGAPLVLEDAFSAVRLRRDDFVLDARFSVGNVGFGARGGGSRYARETLRLAPQVVRGRDGLLGSPLFGAFVWGTIPLARFIDVVITIGLDIVPAPPQIGISTSSGFQTTQAISVASPWLALAVRFH